MVKGVDLIVRKVHTGQFFSKNQEMADENARRIEYEDGMFIVEMPYVAEVQIPHSSGWVTYEYKSRPATKKEMRVICERKLKEDEAKGIFHPFTSN